MRARHGAALAAAAYRRNMWTDQPARVEVWFEKDALSGIFEDILGPYGDPQRGERV